MLVFCRFARVISLSFLLLLKNTHVFGISTTVFKRIIRAMMKCRIKSVFNFKAIEDSWCFKNRVSFRQYNVHSCLDTGDAKSTGKTCYLKSKYFYKTKCVMFKYKTKNASLQVYSQFTTSSKRKRKELFKRSRERGSVTYWKQAALTIPASRAKHRVSVELYWTEV